MELEYIFMIFIMLIVVAVIIGLILTFKDQITATINQYLGNLAGNKNNPQFPKLIDKGSGTFSSLEVDTYINSCYTAITASPIAERKTTDCYILKGNFNADANGILQGLRSDLKGNVTVTADLSRGVAVIEYQDPQGTILVK